MTIITPIDASVINSVVATLQFNDAGLIPAIAQNATSKDILMMAWMNAEAVRETLTTGRVCYFSRSRNQLWRKGETSGHQQQLVAFRYDCDADCILIFVNQTGAACHTNRPNCFFHEVCEDGIHIISDPSH
jgi:phosphoribosyl-AMP cyclohydrolase